LTLQTLVFRFSKNHNSKYQRFTILVRKDVRIRKLEFEPSVQFPWLQIFSRL